MAIPEPPSDPPPVGARPPGLIQRYWEEPQARHYARRTVNTFLTHLAVEGRVSASTQNQALSALLFLDRELLERDLDLKGVIRARRRPRLPVVMSVAEVRAVLERLDGVEALVAGVLYGEGFV